MATRFTRSGQPVPIADLIDTLVRPKRLKKISRLSQAVQTVWDREVDPFLRQHTQIVGFRKNVATVEVDNPILCQELKVYRKSELLQTVNRALTAEKKPTLIDIQFRLKL